jgi:hypothetical protein
MIPFGQCDVIFDKSFQFQARQLVISSLLSMKNGDFDLHATMRDGRMNLLISGSCLGITISPLGERGKVGVPYRVVSKDGTFIVKVNPFRQRLSWRVSNFKPISECMYNPGAPGVTVYHLGLDEFTNELVIGYLLRTVLETGDMKSLAVTYLYGSTYGNQGAAMIEYADVGTVNNITTMEKYTSSATIRDYFIGEGTLINLLIVKENIVYAVIAQIITAIHYLGLAVQFSSGDLKAENILVFSSPMRGTYLSLNLSAPITCKISDFGKSSCTISRPDGARMRIYNDTLLADAYLKISTFHPKIEDGWYIVDDYFVSQTYVWMRHSGDPYYKSFDYYTFIVSLLSINSF